MKYKTQVLEFGTPSMPFRLMITSEEGAQVGFKTATNTGDLMKYFDYAVKKAQELTAIDGINRTVSIEQTILQKNVWMV